MMNLLMAPMGEDLIVERVKKGHGHGHGAGEGECCHNSSEQSETCEGERTVQDRHLTNLGFVQGAKVVVITETQGNLIVKVKDSRVGIGKDIAKKIMVSIAN